METAGSSETLIPFYQTIRDNISEGSRPYTQINIQFSYQFRCIVSISTGYLCLSEVTSWVNGILKRTDWNSIVLEKLIVVFMLKKFRTFYGTPGFIKKFTYIYS
jgi:hypothetical protein